jgi:hypothetical protein
MRYTIPAARATRASAAAGEARGQREAGAGQTREGVGGVAGRERLPARLASRCATRALSGAARPPGGLALRAGCLERPGVTARRLARGAVPLAHGEEARAERARNFLEVCRVELVEGRRL